MKILKAMLWVMVCVTAFGLGTSKARAQQGGRPDWSEIRQNIIDGYRERMDVKDDAEWKVLEAAIGKVVDAGREVMQTRMGGGFGFRRNRGGGDNGGDNNNNRRRGGFFGGPSPEAEDLQKAIDDKAPADEVKAKLAKLRESNTAKEAKLAQAQEELKALLTSRQEAIAVLGGLLK